MEDLFGLLIFAGIAAISMIAKVNEKRKANQKREEQKGQRATRREDLPEATRRMLYGDADGPKMATPRGGESTPGPRPTVEPRTARPAGPPPAAAPPQPDFRPRQSAPAMQKQREQRMAETPQQRRRGALEQPQAPAQRPPKPVAEPRVATTESLREAYRQNHPRREPRPQQQRQQQRPPQRQQQHPPRQRTAHASQQPHPAKRKYKSELAWLFSTPKTVRHGIVMMEILGKPKGLQDF